MRLIEAFVEPANFGFSIIDPFAMGIGMMNVKAKAF